MSYATQLAQFQASLLTHDNSKMAGIIANPERMDIYRDGYHARLEKSVSEDFPALQYYLGDAFQPLVRHYINSTPCRFLNLDLYSVAFADFVTAHIDDIFAHDLVQLEAAIVDVYWRPDSEQLPPDLQPLSADTMFNLRSAAKILCLSYPVEAYLSAFRSNGTAEKPDVAESYVIVLRHQQQVKRHILEPMECSLLSALAAGSPLGVALAQIDDTTLSAAQVEQWFRRWVAEGFLCLP